MAIKTPHPDELDFETIAGRLECIANKIEADDIKLEEALELFEEGVTLAKLGTARLSQAEQRIEQLLKNGSTEPLQVPDLSQA